MHKNMPINLNNKSLTSLLRFLRSLVSLPQKKESFFSFFVGLWDCLGLFAIFGEGKNMGGGIICKNHL